jgi:RNA polymerase sigma-70 factor (ECF subfamily)
MAANDTSHLAAHRIAGWVRDHARAVRGYVLGLVRRADVADDLVQEVFERAWLARDRYRDEGHDRAFLLKIADRLVIDRSRRLGREVNVDEATWIELEPASADEPPVDALARLQASEELAALLGQLTMAQRRVLLLRFFGELTFEEIAIELNCPLNTALSHCRRGLAALRRLLTAKQA